MMLVILQAALMTSGAVAAEGTEVEAGTPDAVPVERADSLPRTELAVSGALPGDTFSGWSLHAPTLGLRAARKANRVGVGLEGVVMLSREQVGLGGLCNQLCEDRFGASWKGVIGPTALLDLPLWGGKVPGGLGAALGPTAVFVLVVNDDFGGDDPDVRLGGVARLSARIDLHRTAAVELGVQQHWARIFSNEEAVRLGTSHMHESRTLFELAFVARIPDRLTGPPEPEPEHDEPPELR